MLEPARLEFTGRGPRSLLFDDRYHAEIGPRAQATIVFLGGCNLPQDWNGRAQFTIVETGFGLGFNFLSVWQAWRSDPRACQRLHFLSIERYPVGLADLARAHAAEPDLADCARQLRLALPPPIAGLHRLEFEQGRVMLTLVYGDGASALAQLCGEADAVFLDGFAPPHNPALWSAAVLAQLARLARPGARLASWCAAGEVRRQLALAGFEVRAAAGFGAKRETTQAVRLATAPPDGSASGLGRDGGALPDDPPGTNSSRHPGTGIGGGAVASFGAGRRAARATPGLRSAAIIGAGLAGCHLAWRLAVRGWQVTLIDAAAVEGSAASGNPVGVVRPLFSRDDNRSTRFTRAALLFARQAWAGARHPSIRAAWHPSGVLQLARSAEQWTQWADCLARQALPSEYVFLLDAADARRRLGLPVAQGGLMFPLAGWAEPAALCRALLQAAGAALVQRFGVAASAIEAAGGGGWLVLDGTGRTVACAAHVVFANGAGPHRQHLDDVAVSQADDESPVLPPFLPPDLRAPQTLRGEITSIACDRLRDLDLPVCSEGYLCPLPDGGCSLGATYDEVGGDAVTDAGIAENLARLTALSGLSRAAATVLGGRAAWRSIAADRLPLVGRDPRHEGWWHLRAMASRGLVWSPLCAETLACEMNAEALPLSAELRAAIAVDRHTMRKKPSHASHHPDRHRRQPAA